MKNRFGIESVLVCFSHYTTSKGRRDRGGDAMEVGMGGGTIKKPSLGAAFCVAGNQQSNGKLMFFGNSFHFFYRKMGGVRNHMHGRFVF